MASLLPAQPRKRIALIFGAFALAGLLIWFALTGWGPSRTNYPLQGVDVSHHQGAIEWKSVKAAGTDFAYIKASEGADMRDPAFAENWKGAREAGLKRGAYHFFTLCRLARDQATNFIATVPREDDALSHAVDLEFGGNCAARPERPVMISEIASFIQMVEAHSGKPMILYMTQEFEDYYHVSEAINRPLWLRRIYFPPDFTARPWIMWQANNHRRVDGISGAVDWNVVRPNE